MALDLENDAAFSVAVDGLPRVVELITTVPDEKRALAFAAAQQSYLQTAQALGYEESDAQQWASTVMSILEITALAAERVTKPSLFQHEPSAMPLAEVGSPETAAVKASPTPDQVDTPDPFAAD